ncbi:MAG: methyltransferase domain-containing protein [Oscillospiraceae bacterium]|nr:methyltransferase domain-containing protein [Oscillospiraceae bacterium]
MYENLIAQWYEEERIAKIHGWDFSHIAARHEECGELPWDYRAEIARYRRDDQKLLDIDTGGGEVLLSLGHPYENTTATENYAPNAALCREKLAPLGITVCEADAKQKLPLADASFDLVIDRHGDFNAEEIYRVLKPGGVFVTQQVGAENDRALVELLLGEDTALPFPEQTLSQTKEKFECAGFSILAAQEAFRPIRFYDVGALVWFARVIKWEFPNFSVKKCLPQLLRAQEFLEENGCIEAMTHRFLLVAKR